MPKLYGYILGQLLVATGLILTTLAVALWLTQSLRFLELAVNGGAGLTEFLALVLFTLPRFLTVLLPIAAGIGIVFVYNKLLNDSELVVMRAVGVSQWNLAQPGLLLSLLVLMVLLALHTYAQPSAK
ncbi:MAG: LptF/LptG family permease, partial [Pseudomonadota bacterium]